MAIMKMAPALLFLSLTIASLASTCQSSSLLNHNQEEPMGVAGPHPHTPAVNCGSWRLAVETSNIKDWKIVPQPCVGYVGKYMLGPQYKADLETVVAAALSYVNTLKVAGDGKDIWVFDIDETTLSNLPYYSRPDIAFGGTKFNNTKFEEYIGGKNVPAIPSVQKLYSVLVSKGIKIAFIEETRELFRYARVKNLKAVGYSTYEKLILKKPTEMGTTAVEFKSQKRGELVAAGYRIVGNIGDQWSDLTGTNVGKRTFKLPNPMYYVI